tara:strand:+ start:148 stop:408 length:261 start_codon:yes stop_codon:yes gene_type:complete
MKTIKKLTIKFAADYIHYNYGYLKHDIKKLVKASRTTAKQYNCIPLDIFFFMIEDEPIKNLYTHSYGFNTSEGREIKETFKNYYNN